MKKIASHIKTSTTDLGDMVEKRLKESALPAQQGASEPREDGGPEALYDTHYIVDDLQAGTVVRKAAVQLGLLVDDGADLLYRANPVRQLRSARRKMRSEAGAAKAIEHTPHYDVRYRQKIDIQAQDGTLLCANLFAPQTDNPDQVFPAIVLINSWLMDKHQYVIQARRFARNGYIVLSYSARGWGKSGGVVDVGGSNDVSDLSTIIDWLIDNAPVDALNIGSAGISYGSGLSLLGAAHDERIKTVVCMSGWSDLLQAFWSQQTPREVCAKVLVTSSDMAARTDDQLSFLLNSLIKNQHMDQVKAWAKQRSPATYLKKYNKRQPPIYLIQNLQDELFQPNAVLDFYAKLQGPKRIDLNMGTHASAEISGILGLKNHLWTRAHAWFDYWLRDVPNDIMDQPPVNFEFERHSGFKLRLGKHEGYRQALDEWPSKALETRSFYLSPPTDQADHGKLAMQPAQLEATQMISSALGTSKSTAGLPFVSSSKSAHLNMPLKLDLAKVNPRLAVVYQSETFVQRALLLGAPELHLQIETSRPQVQLIAYLYEGNEEGRCQLITHGPFTRHAVAPNKPMAISFELVTACYEVRAGHHLILVMDTSDLQYKIPTKDDFELTFHHGLNTPPRLDLPFAETDFF